MFNLSIYLERNFNKEYKEARKASRLLQEFAEFKGLEKSLIHEMCLGTELNKIGYVSLPKVITCKLKYNKQLTLEERDEYKKYPLRGIEILSRKYKKEYDNSIIIGIILESKERFDGKGFPLGLSGDQINETSYLAMIVIWFIEQIYEGDTICEILNKLERDQGMVPQGIRDDFIKFISQKNDKIQEIIRN